MSLVELKIQDVAFGGKGVARHAGKAVFVPFTIDGENISAEIVREKKNFAEAELIDVNQSSPYRVDPQCPYFKKCGGCSYQHIEYEHQLALKWRQVRDVLRRIGGLADAPMRPIVPSPIAYRYRNRITVHAQDGVVGFFQRDSHCLIDIERCPISTDEINHELAKMRSQRVRDGHYTLRGPSAPRVFAQTNDAVAEQLRDLITGFIPTDQELLIDAYCGAGFFAKHLLGKFNRVIGIDWDRFAIEEATKGATAEETYIAGDVEEALKEVAAVHRTANRQSGSDRLGSIAPTTLIVDPPAIGLTNVVRQTILDLQPGTFVYVSCNPATLARDLKELVSRFQLEAVTPLDMFPQTAEIEVAVLLQPKAGNKS